MSRYQFDPYGRSEAYVARMEREMQVSELRRQAASGSRSPRPVTRGFTHSLSLAWIYLRANLAPLRRHPAPRSY